MSAGKSPMACPVRAVETGAIVPETLRGAGSLSLRFLELHQRHLGRDRLEVRPYPEPRPDPLARHPDEIAEEAHPLVEPDLHDVVRNFALESRPVGLVKRAERFDDAGPGGRDPFAPLAAALRATARGRKAMAAAIRAALKHQYPALRAVPVRTVRRVVRRERLRVVAHRASLP